VATSSEDGSIRIWRWRLTPERKRAPGIPVFFVDFITEWISENAVPVQSCLELSDGHLAVMLRDSPDVRLVDPAASVVRWVLFGHTAPVTALAECHDGCLVTGGADGAVRLWARRSWQEDAKPRPRDAEPARGGDFDRPRTPPDVAWAEPGQEAAHAGVSSMALFAHMQQAQRGECVSVALRVFVQSAEHLPKADALSLSDPYLAVCVVEGDVAPPVSVRTPVLGKPAWHHRCVLRLPRTLEQDETWRFDASYELDFEVVYRYRWSGRETVMGVLTVSADEVLAQIAKAGDAGAAPRPSKLYAPPGEGPYEDLDDATLTVGFALSGTDALECQVEDATGLPPLGLGQRCYVSVTARQGHRGRQRVHHIDVEKRTRVVSNSANPSFKETVELEVPVYLTDTGMKHGEGLRLHIEARDHDAGGSDDLLATLTLPLSEVLKADGQALQPYDMQIAPAFPQATGAGARQPRVVLGFQALTPCPLQLRCTVERARGRSTYAGTGREELAVRVRYAEGNPIQPALTAVRTRTVWQSCNPAWREKCVLLVPAWLHTREPKSGSSAALLAGWVHADRAEDHRAVVCLDIYDADKSGSDDFLGRAVVPFQDAVEAVRERSGRVQAVPLTNHPKAEVFVSFEGGPGHDQITVYVERAKNLPAGDTMSSDPYCVVSITELNAFEEPSDRAHVRYPGIPESPVAASDVRGDPVWEHSQVLELPGAHRNGAVAARPNWFLLFEVLDASGKGAEKPVVAHAIAPLSAVLNDLRTETSKAVCRPDALARRLDGLRTVAGGPPSAGVEDVVIPVERELPLVPLAPDGRPAVVASTESADAAREKAKVLGSDAPARGASKGEIVFHEAARAEAAEREDEDRDKLLVRFEVVSRWRGFGRGAKCPPIRQMAKPSPVASLVTLVSSIVAGHEDGNVFVWDAKGTSSVPLHQFQAHKAPICCMSFLPEMNCVVTAGCVKTREGKPSTDSSLCLWSSSSFEKRQTVSLHGNTARCMRALSGLGAKDPPSLAVGTDTSLSRTVQLLRLEDAVP